MEQIHSMEQYSSLVAEFTQKYGRPISNGTLLPEQLRSLIEKRSLYVHCTSCSLLFFQPALEHWDMWYYLPAHLPQEKIVLPADRPVFISLVGSTSRERTGLEQVFWKNSGFSSYKKSRRMVKQINSDVDEMGIPSNFVWLTPASVSVVLSRLIQSFDVLADQIPTGEELTRAAEEKRLFGFQDESGQLLAFNHFQKEKKFVVSLHEWVDPSKRSQGIGSRLVKTCVSLALRDGMSRVYAWVNSDNLSSEKMHQNIGFQFDGKITEKLLWTPRK